MSDVDAILERAGLDREIPSAGVKNTTPGSTIARYERGFLRVLYDGKEVSYPLSADALAIFLQDVAREAG